jgi:hypothetical protein
VRSNVHIGRILADFLVISFRICSWREQNYLISLEILVILPPIPICVHIYVQCDAAGLFELWMSISETLYLYQAKKAVIQWLLTQPGRVWNHVKSWSCEVNVCFKSCLSWEPGSKQTMGKCASKGLTKSNLLKHNPVNGSMETCNQRCRIFLSATIFTYTAFLYQKEYHIMFCFVDMYIYILVYFLPVQFLTIYLSSAG